LQTRRSYRRHCRRTSRAAYDLVFVAGGYQLRTKPRFSAAIRAANAGELRDASLPELTPTELLAVTAIAYLQPVTLSRSRGSPARKSAATSSAA